MYTIDSIHNLGRECSLALSFSQFADHLRPRAFGPLFLRDSMIGTGKLRGRAVATRIDAITLDLTTMAGVAGPLDRRRHGVYSGVAVPWCRNAIRSTTGSGLSTGSSSHWNVVYNVCGTTNVLMSTQGGIVCVCVQSWINWNLENLFGPS